MDILEQILQGIHWFIFGFFAFNVGYLGLLSIAGNFRSKPNHPSSENKLRFAVLIPGYMEDEVIVEVAKEALKQKYPSAFYEVIVIADSFAPSTLQELQQLPIRVIEVFFDNSTKSKSINKALEQIDDRNFEAVVILDADNLMAVDFLCCVNKAFQAGYKVVQGHRTAKNRNTPFAILDAANEEINNHIFRKGQRALGMSSSLIGSAMAFELDYFREIMSSIDDVAGEDKEMQLKILKDGVKIEYLENAHVLDEKVQNARVFSKQRTRWIATQFYYLKPTYLLDGLRQLLFKGNIDFFNKIIQTFILPRILLLGSLTFFTILTLIIQTRLSYWYWGGLLISTGLILLIAVPGSFFNKDLIKALINIPKAFLYMLKALFSIKGADKKFIHTPHSASNELKS
ncbi:glycosyltransferase family 2 protein [Fulvivirgaceae bacterium BMA10]|uniref:Glycosyltransferase family 2 protein n=1 Tax=Splendidivirga corallicola TaxID=3051826 RepID=A0ABT8KHL2_9BACT|nr:glycosyltransferase family 2 protein [Fulvivirgaceae bacterium BMA10]